MPWLVLRAPLKVSSQSEKVREDFMFYLGKLILSLTKKFCINFLIILDHFQAITFFLKSGLYPDLSGSTTKKSTFVVCASSHRGAIKKSLNLLWKSPQMVGGQTLVCHQMHFFAKEK